VQINLLISTALAARFLGEGAVSWLYYADRLNQLPLGIIGIGVGTALLPAMSRLLAAGEASAALAQQNRAIELVLLLTLPAAAGLALVAAPIIGVLFQHGAFTALDTQKTAAALAAFALGLPAYVLIKVLTPGFHARSDTRTPVRVALGAIRTSWVRTSMPVMSFLTVLVRTRSAPRSTASRRRLVLSESLESRRLTFRRRVRQVRLAQLRSRVPRGSTLQRVLSPRT
jgi:putative peptidoglycan lipid II flippase